MLLTLVVQTATRPPSAVLLEGVAALSRLPVVARVDLRSTPLRYLVALDRRAETESLVAVLSQALDLPVTAQAVRP